MLKILFSPSESKNSGGNEKQKELLGSNNSRVEILQEYNNIIKNGNEDEICKLFGFKKFTDCKEYVCDIFNSPLMCAIERYRGVAYDYLEFDTLTKNQQEYLKENTIIFSNLFGAILGGDTIPNYKVKQGNDIGEFIPDRFYNKRFSYQLDLYLTNSDILDLRAGYYDKFYKPSKPYTTLKFLKNGKVVSHWAKAYRGIVLREIAKADINTIDEFMKLDIEGLIAQEIKIIKNKTEIVYRIED
jgi:cytoplasmic iron level regulating protein YaaA (DUF328/UPF0246 family)